MIRYALVILVIASPSFAQDAGPAAWAHIHQVLSHPRCANCHVGPDNMPMWSGSSYGAKSRPHGMNINAGISRNGTEYIPCSSCHTLENSQLPHGPPGAHAAWSLAPVSMQWFGKSSTEICSQINDTMRNNFAMPKVIKHIENEPLVQWGWKPGPGREPAPYSAAQLVEFLKDWEKAEKPCPTQ